MPELRWTHGGISYESLLVANYHDALWACLDPLPGVRGVKRIMLRVLYIDDFVANDRVDLRGKALDDSNYVLDLVLATGPQRTSRGSIAISRRYKSRL